MKAWIPTRSNSGVLWLVAAVAAIPALYSVLRLVRNGATDRALVESTLENLRSQLAQVELEIKELLWLLDSRRLEEMDQKGRIEDDKDQTARLLGDLEKAADSYADLLQTISSLFAQ